MPTTPIARPGDASGARERDPREERSRAVALQAARALLAEQGWEGVTHLRVAERSGLGRATIYRHWPDPAALRRDAMAEEVSVFHATPTGDLRADLLAELGAMRRELIERGQARVMATLVNQAERDPEMLRFKTELVRQGCSVLRRLLDDALARGELRPGCDVDDAIAALVGPILFRRVFASGPITDQLLETVVRDFLTAHAATQGP